MVASSPKLRPIFEQEPQIILTTSSPRTLRFNLHAMPSSLLKMIGMDDTDELTQEGFPHCDCALLAYFLTHRVGNVSPTIGVSKLSRFASQLYIEEFRLATQFLEVSRRFGVNHSRFILTTAPGRSARALAH